ncbi:MAG: hypothetical protein CL609_22870 [Anaerolineaceae bacterium]|nr:hypothetical protein [Anaerolineaceae bacterium]
MKKSLIIISLLIFSISITSCLNSSTEKEVIAPTSTPIPLTIEIDEKIISDNYGELKLKGVLIFDEIDDENFPYSQSTGTKAVLFIFDVKNMNNTEVELSNFVSIDIIYNENFVYKNNDCQSYDPSNKKETLIPLANTLIMCVTELPNEVFESFDNLVTKIFFSNNSYKFIGPYDNADDYLSAMSEVNKKWNGIFGKLTSLSLQITLNKEPNKNDLVRFAEEFSDIHETVLNLLEEMSAINAPIYYLEAHTIYIDGMKILEEGLKYCGNVDVAKSNPIKYSSDSRICNEKINEAINIIIPIAKSIGIHE